MLGTQTQGSRMEGTDESTELWRHPNPGTSSTNPQDFDWTNTKEDFCLETLFTFETPNEFVNRQICSRLMIKIVASSYDNNLLTISYSNLKPLC